MACVFFEPHAKCLEDVIVAGLQPGVNVGVHQVVHDVWVSFAAVHSGVQMTVQSDRKTAVYRGYGHLCHPKHYVLVEWYCPC